MKANSFTFYQPDFLAALAAYQLQKAGFSVKIILSDQLNEHLQSEYTSYYPEKLTDVVSSKLNYRFLNSISNLFPHLITRKRVYTFHTNNEWNAKNLAAIDKLMGYDREMAAFPIKPNIIFNHDGQILKKGAQVIEYRFDRHQAIYELLKKCKQLGSQILFDDSPKLKETIILSKPIDTFTSSIKGKRLPVENAVILKSDSYDVELYNLQQGLQINIQSLSTTIDKSKAIELLNDLDIQLEEAAINSVSKSVTKSTELVISDAKLSDLRAGWNKVVDLLRNNFSLNKRAFNLDKPAEKLSANYTKLQLACEQQYDQAKQTGIQFRSFEKIYYRYINSIEEMIESAYEMMSFERDPEKIWDSVLEDHLKEEWNNLIR